MFIKIRDTSDDLILLNVNHIIKVEPFVIKNYKMGEDDDIGTKITGLGAMTTITIIRDSVEEVIKLIENATKTKQLWKDVTTAH